MTVNGTTTRQETVVSVVVTFKHPAASDGAIVMDGAGLRDGLAEAACSQRDASTEANSLASTRASVATAVAAAKATLVFSFERKVVWRGLQFGRWQKSWIFSMFYDAH